LAISFALTGPDRDGTMRIGSPSASDGGGAIVKYPALLKNPDLPKQKRGG